MSDIPPDFDLKFLPDWMKEEPSKNAYANYEGEAPDRPNRDFNKPRPRSRDGGGGGGAPRSRGPGNSPQRGPRPGGDNRGGGDRGGNRGRQDDRGDRNQQRRAPEPQRDEKPAPVTMEFLPEQHCAVALAKQIKGSSRAYPLFDLARMFLGKPDRHRVKITSADPAVILYQIGEDGPVSLDKQTVEKNAFSMSKHLYYEEETTQGEPPKGNYTNVARCRLSGILLGPTSHHAYQPTLRKIYEERYSRRMSFPEYQRQIETSNDPAAIEAWKEQSRTVTKFKTLQEAEPLTFDSVGEAERHFREHYLAKSLGSGKSFEISGEASRKLPDRSLSNAVRYGWEDENRFPGHLMNHLRREFIHAGLYIFKHRNRIQLVSAIRPAHFGSTQQTLSDSVTQILKVIAETPKCTRVELAAKILPLHPEEDPTKLKSQLASDLHWLTHAGHVIELHNGMLELPVVPNPPTPPSPKKNKQGAQGSQQKARTETAPATSAEDAAAPVASAVETAPEPEAPVENENVAPESEPEPIAEVQIPEASASEPVTAAVEESPAPQTSPESQA